MIRVNDAYTLSRRIGEEGRWAGDMGELKPLSLRLMAKQVEEVELPSTSWVEEASKQEAAPVSES